MSTTTHTKILKNEEQNTCMDVFKCKRCGYETDHKNNLTRHLKRKKDCDKVVEDVKKEDLLLEVSKREYNEKTYDCCYCDKRFNTRQSKSRHLLTCKKNPENLPQEAMVPISVVNELQHQVTMLKEKVEKMECISHSNITNNTTNNNINNGTVNNIVINAFGKEDISYLTESKGYQGYMIKCLKSKIDGVVDFLVKQHFHPNHPENHNMIKLNKKDDFIEVHTGREWKTRFKDDVLEEVFTEMSGQFAAFVEEVFTEDGVLKKDVLDKFVETVGKPLDWDISIIDTYEYDREDISEEKKSFLRRKIYALAVEHIYKKSREMHSK